MKKHKENARKVIAILDDVNRKLKALFIEHAEDQKALDARYKKAA